MTSLAPQTSKKRFWWWNSHISPKNSKWLEENLYDMDTKVKQMFKLLEEDADSFARRAEMYYKKRPELLKLVEEFYKAYRALAERYDNATGALRQAQRTMAEAFPNQVPSTSGDDFPSPSGSDSRTPEALPVYSVSGSDDTPKGSSGRRARKGLVFDDVDHNGTRNVDAETKISALESDFARLEAEKEAAVLECEEMRKRISSFQEERNKFIDFDQKMEEMKSTVTKLENEREICVVKCQTYERKISELEKYLFLLQNDTANFVVEASTMKEEMMKMGAEKEDFVRDHQQLLLAFSKAEAKSLLACDIAKRTEKEFEVANKKFSEEKQMMRREITEIICKKDAAEDEHYLSESLIHCLKSELAAKDQEMKILLTSLEEDHLKYVKSETAFQSLQQIHSQCQKELLSVSSESQNQCRTIQDIELRNQQLQHEVLKLVSERKSLNDILLSSVMEVEELKVHNNMLTDAIKKLEGEIDLCTNERNVLQQDTHNLKEELNKVKNNHLGVVGDIESVGLSIDNFPSRVKNLMEDCERGKVEYNMLMERITVLEKIAQEKQLLENSLSDMCVERETMNSKKKMLEESYESLLSDNSSLVDRKAQLESQLLAWKIELESVTKSNSSLEKSFLESHSTIEFLGMRLRNLGDSCSELEDEKANLVLVKENLALELSEYQTKLETVKAQHGELLKEKESLMNEFEKLKASYSTKVEEHENLKIKSKKAEDSFFTLETEKSQLHSNYNGLVEQIESFGFHPLSLSTSLNDLLKENAQLKQTCDKGIVERSALLGLKSVLTEDKASLESQLVICNQNVESAMGKISSLEKSLSESCSKVEMLEQEKSELALTKEQLSTEFRTSRTQLDTLKGEYEELEKEMDSVLSEVEKLNGCYSSEVRDHENLKTKSKNLQDSFFLLEKENFELQSNHKSFVGQVESVGFKTESLASSLNDLLEKNRSLEKSLTDSFVTIEMLETQLRNFEGMCSKLESEKQILEKEKGSLHNEAQQLQARYSSETQEHQSLKIKSKSLEHSFASLAEEKSELHNSYISYVNQVESVGFKPETVATSLRTLLEENSQLKEHCERGKGEISSLDSQLLHLTGELESAVVKNGSLERSLAESRFSLENLEVKLGDFEDEIKCLTILKMNLAGELEGLTVQYKELENKNGALEKEKASLLKEVETLEASYSTETEEHQNLKVKSKSLEKSLLSIETEKSELHCSYYSFVAQVESVGFKPETLASSVKSLLDSNSQLEEMCHKSNAEKSCLESQLLMINEELESFIEKNCGFEKHVLESLETLEMKLRNLTVGLDTLNSDYKALAKQKELLVNELEELKGCYSDEMQVHQNLKVKTKGLEDSFFSLETEKSELHINYSSFVAQVESVGFKPETLASSVKSLIDSNSQLEEVCHKSSAETLSLKSQLLIINEELECFIEKNCCFEKHVLESLETLEMKLRSLTMEWNTLNSDYKALAKQNKLLVNELEELKDCYSDEMQNHQNLKVKSKGLEDSLLFLESKNSELHNNHQNFVTQVESIGLKPESFSASVRSLQEESTRLKQTFDSERSALLEEKLTLASSCFDLHTKLEHVKKEEINLRESHRIAVFDVQDQLKHKCCEFEIEACILESSIRSLNNRYKNSLEEMNRESRENKRDLKLLQGILLSFLNALDSKHWTDEDLMQNQTQTGQEAQALVSSLKDDHTKMVIECSILVSFLHEMERSNRLLAASISDLEEELFAEKTLSLVLKSILKEMGADLRESEFEAEALFKGLQESAFMSGYFQGKLNELTTSKSEETGTVPKDIALDHVSETSSVGFRRNPSDDDQMLKLWETTNHVSSSSAQAAAAHSGRNQSMNSSELSIDKVEISKTFSGTLWDAKKLLERLRSDEAKLSDMAGAVGGMKGRVPQTAEHDGVRRRLEESNVAIAILAERNARLRRTVEENAAWFEERRASDGDVAGDVAGVKRRRVREEARSGSEKIGRLEMELQKVEFILMKEKEKMVRKNTVPLRDYLYGKKRSPEVTARKRFCVCLRL